MRQNQRTPPRGGHGRRGNRHQSHGASDSRDRPNPDLGRWRRMLDESTYRPLSKYQAKELFRLGASFLTQDIGTIQQAIRLFADEAGLQIIKNLIETEIPRASSIASRFELWNDQVQPLFQILSDQKVADSAILEEYVILTLNFMVGNGALRFEKLFSFVIRVLEEYPSASSPANHNAPGGRDAALECCLSIFSMLLDSKTSNLVDQTFSVFAALLEGLLTSEDEPGFSLLQSKRYLEYIQRRLGIGQAIPSTSQKTSRHTLGRATFVLDKDLPGHLSRSGRRHNNDHTSIRDIHIFPTSEEITSTRVEYWPTTDPSQSHLQGIQWLLDRNFRLLREDTIGQLRDIARAEMEALRHASGNKKAKTKTHTKIYTYENAEISSIKFTARQGLRFVVRFPQMQHLPSEPKAMNTRRDWWERCRRLQSDALVCVINEGGSALFCTVSHYQQPTHTRGRHGEDNHGDEVDPTLWEDGKWAYVSIKLVDADRSSIEWMAEWSRNTQRYILVEFPGVLLPAFKPTLLALQKMARDLKIPFADLLVPQQTGRPTLDIPIPEYARRPGFRFNLKAITCGGEDFWHQPGEAPKAAELSRVSQLDQTQSLALLSSLNRCLALTEGPPGTGKSYTGGALLRVLIDHKKVAKLGPIICVTYTNHALDQVLEHLHRDGMKNIIRIGSRSQSEVLKDVNLRAVSKKEQRTSNENFAIGRSFGAMRTAALESQGNIHAWKSGGNATSIKQFLEHSHPHHCRALFGGIEDDGWKVGMADNHRGLLRRWRNGGQLFTTQRPLDVLRDADLGSMSRVERRTLYDDWVKTIQQQCIQQTLRAQEDWHSAMIAQEGVHRDINARVLRQADVIGITTSSMANNMDLLEKIHAKVLICEEAGEVLEAHLLTTLLPSIEHAIFIGDHLQLRPQIANYDLQAGNPAGCQYSLDVSLFERLVSPFKEGDAGVPYTVLQTQRRMHPSISALIRPTLYPELEDAESVMNYPEVVGLRRRLFWLQHRNFESTGNRQLGFETSYSNPFEVEMALALISHIVRQGVYGSKDIAVLTPYKAQFRLLRERLGSMYEVTLNELDKAEVELDEAQEAGVDFSKPTTNTIGKVRLSESVRIATIDNFQGEEAKVVIISLVRSNEERKSGFLKTSNRINVLLSRAQHGMFIIGDSYTASSVPMWAQVISILQSQGNIGDALELQCPRHPDTPINASQPDHFLQFSPDGGCLQPCEQRLSCGHACTGRCHAAVLHCAVKCLEPCPRRMPNCDHDCPLVCSDKCPKKCKVVLAQRNLVLKCQHIVESPECWQAQNPDSVVCRVPIVKTVPGCNHKVTVACHESIQKDGFKCDSACGTPLPCGHACRKSCYCCRRREGGKIVGESHPPCNQTCGRNYSTCQHACTQPCHSGSGCKPCEAPCEVCCSHSKCSKRCHEPCIPCAEGTCASRCPHSACTMPCAAPCDWVPCSKRCEEKLPCGHRCPSLCGEICPDAKFCHICAEDDIKSIQVDLILMETYGEIDPDETPCIFLNCGHIFTIETLDGQMGMSEHFTMSADGLPMSIKSSLQPFSVSTIKVCPSCRGSLRSISRYGRIVRSGMLDEATKRFIAWSTQTFAELGSRFLKQQEALQEEDMDKIFVWKSEAPAEITLKSSLSDQIRTIATFNDKGSLRNLIVVYWAVNKHVKMVQREEQPFQRVADLVRHARRHRGAEGGFTFDESSIQLKGYIQSVSLLYRCGLLILTQLVNFCGSQTELRMDLSANKKMMLRLIELARKTKRPYEEVEGHIYYSHACALERRTLPSGDSDVLSTKSDSIRQDGNSHIAAAKVLLAMYPSVLSLKDEVDTVDTMLRDMTFYAPVSLDEKKAIYAAMMREFHSTGHWYTCVNGHPFTIGECGGAMQLARCPECGETVGGEHHQPAAGVRRADDMEELARGIEEL